MNSTGALKKAKELLGPKALVERARCKLMKPDTKGRVHCSGIGSHAQPCPGGLWECKIGRVELGMFFAIKVGGQTWEEAFAKYQYYDHKDYCRKALKERPCATCKKLRKVLDRIAATTWRSLVEV